MSLARLESSAIPPPAPPAAPARPFHRASKFCNTSDLSPNSSTEEEASPPFHIVPWPPVELPDSPPPPAPESPCSVTNAPAPEPAGSPSAATPLRATSFFLQTGRCVPNRSFRSRFELPRPLCFWLFRWPPAHGTGPTPAVTSRRSQ